ncbi:MAG: fructose,6-bisphosphate aldolase [Symbiobacteriaceae bacterium]|jgi:fructose-bisphosphate aldolase class II|nr:fructose,6-bisphosphate aldolase [Symbiobacteriaceae bacterium]
MPLVNMKEILKNAEAGKYAVGAFGIQNLETVQAVIEAAVEEKSPAILIISEGAIKYAGLQTITNIVKTLAEAAPVPIVAHLDHGPSFKMATQCIVAGFKSVMVDASHFSYDENVAITRKVVEMAHAVGATVEGEIGKIGGVEENIVVAAADATMTEPDEAAQFVVDTGIDAVAVAIGNAHGLYHGEPKLDIERMGRIYKAVKAVAPEVALVLHGGSGTPDHMIRDAIAAGVSKINIGTELKLAFVNGVRDTLTKKPGVDDPRHLIGPAREAVKAVTKEKMRLFGSSGRI